MVTIFGHSAIAARVLSSVVGCMLVTLTASVGLAAGAGEMAEGERLYAAGDFTGAAAIFKKLIKEDAKPANKNITAHYFLANCFLAQKKYSLAQSEYRNVINATRESQDSESRELNTYCQNALDGIEKLHAPPAPTPSLPAESTQNNQNNLQNNIQNNIQSQADAEKMARVEAILADSHAQAQKLKQRAEAECRPIVEEQMATMKNMSRKTRAGAEYFDSDERRDAQDDYSRRISEIKGLAERQGQGIIEQGKRDAANVGRGLSNLDDLLKD